MKENHMKIDPNKSVTEKIEEYERKVFIKVKNLKEISQYDESLKH